MAEQLNVLNLNEQKVEASKRLSYPANIFDNSTDYVKFDFYKYVGPFQTSGQGDTTTTDGDVSKQLEVYNQSNKAQYERYPGASTILMYMPEDISTGYQTDWSGKGFSNAAANILRGAGQANMGDGAGTLDSFVSGITTAATSLPTTTAQGLVSAINALGAGDVTTNDVLQGSMGVVLNPNTELMFQGFKMRSFGLKYKMSARNANESNVIRKIIGTFKQVALPTFGVNPEGAAGTLGGALLDAINSGNNDPNNQDKKPETANQNYIGVPGLCQVSFMSGTKLHPWIPQYKICALTEVSINYTPDGTYTTYDEFRGALNESGSPIADRGAPVAVELTLQFSETKLVYSNEINIDTVSY